MLDKLFTIITLIHISFNLKCDSSISILIESPDPNINKKIFEHEMVGNVFNIMKLQVYTTGSEDDGTFKIKLQLEEGEKGQLRDLLLNGKYESTNGMERFEEDLQKIDEIYELQENKVTPQILMCGTAINIASFNVYTFALFEYTGKDLNYTLKNNYDKCKNTTLIERLNYYYQMSQSLMILHNQKINHCNLSFNTITLNPETSKAMFLNTRNVKGYENCSGANNGYIAPENLDKRLDERINNYKSDIFSLGIIMWQIEDECRERFPTAVSQLENLRDEKPKRAEFKPLLKLIALNNKKYKDDLLNEENPHEFYILKFVRAVMYNKMRAAIYVRPKDRPTADKLYLAMKSLKNLINLIMSLEVADFNLVISDIHAVLKKLNTTDIQVFDSEFGHLLEDPEWISGILEEKKKAQEDSDIADKRVLI